MDTLLNPVLIIEVLSPSTEGYDRGANRMEYLREYVLIAQDRYSIERYIRSDDGLWTLSEANSPESLIELVTIGCQLRVDEVYEKVRL